MTPSRLRVAVTRDEPPDGPLTRALARAGLEPVSCPVTRTAPAPEPGALADAARRLESFDDVVLASERALSALLGARGDAGFPPRLRVAAVGARTAAAARAAGAREIVTAAVPGAEALLAALRERSGWAGRRVLLPRAAEGLDTLARGLAALGASVETVVAYQTLPRPASEVAAAWRAAGAEAVVIASPSAARALVGAIGTGPLRALAAVVAIGPTTATALRALGVASVRAAGADWDAIAAAFGPPTGIQEIPR